MRLNDQEMLNVNGGGIGLWSAIGGLIVLVVGIIDGYINPKKCN